MGRERVGILISGIGSNMVALVEAMRAPDHPGTAAVVISNVPDAQGLARANAMGIPVAAIDHREFGADRAAFDAAMDGVLAEHGVGLVACAGFMRIMTDDFVSRWGGRMLNIHPSLLPAFRGLDTHARALAARVAIHGCTVHEVIPELDAGPILGQGAVAVRAGDTAGTLAHRVLDLEHRLYPAVLRNFLLDPDAAREERLALWYDDRATD